MEENKRKGVGGNWSAGECKCQEGAGERKGELR